MGVRARAALLIGAMSLSACASVQPVPQIPPNVVRSELTSEPTAIIAPQAVPKTLPDTPTPNERPEVDASLRRLSAEGFKVLACRYLGEFGTVQRAETAYFLRNSQIATPRCSIAAIQTTAITNTSISGTRASYILKPVSRRFRPPIRLEGWATMPRRSALRAMRGRWHCSKRILRNFPRSQRHGYSG